LPKHGETIRIFSLDEADEYEAQFDPLLTDRRARRQRKPVARYTYYKRHADVVAELADASGLESGFQPTYTPSEHEAGWLVSSLGGFYDQHYITDIVRRVRGGKEATVYCCAAHAVTGAKLLAAKVYRPRMFRALRNDAQYRQGREILTETGRPVNKSETRLMRAINKKTALGVQITQTSWLMHEYATIQRLYELGGAAPRPYACSENAILMSYVGDERRAAPTLNAVTLGRAEAERLWNEALRNVELLLKLGVVHGDLSAYNLLYWQGKITLIDFPQVTAIAANRRARQVLRRDLERLAEYFAAQGVERDPAPLLDALWARYGVEIPLDPLAGEEEEMEI